MVAVFAVLVVCIYMVFAMAAYYTNEIPRLWNKNFKIAAIVGVIFLALAVAIPSQETCYKMIISSQVTAENLDKVEDTIERIADYVADKDE